MPSSRKLSVEDITLNGWREGYRRMRDSVPLLPGRFFDAAVRQKYRPKTPRAWFLGGVAVVKTAVGKKRIPCGCENLGPRGTYVLVESRRGEMCYPCGGKGYVTADDIVRNAWWKAYRQTNEDMDDAEEGRRTNPFEFWPAVAGGVVGGAAYRLLADPVVRQVRNATRRANPGSDEEMRELERRAAQGDAQADMRLRSERARRGLTPPVDPRSMARARALVQRSRLPRGYVQRFSGDAVVILTVNDAGIYSGVVRWPGGQWRFDELRNSPADERRFAIDSAQAFDRAARGALGFGSAETDERGYESDVSNGIMSFAEGELDSRGEWNGEFVVRRSPRLPPRQNPAHLLLVGNSPRGRGRRAPNPLPAGAASLLLVGNPGRKRNAGYRGHPLDEPARRANYRDSGDGEFTMRLPAERVKGTISLAEARKRWKGQVDLGVAGFRDFHGKNVEVNDEVILYDDGRPDVQVAWVAGISPEVTYGGSPTDVPSGSVKDEALWVHKAGETDNGKPTGKPTYLIGLVAKDGSSSVRSPETHDFMLIGNMVAKKGWLRK